MPAVVVPVLSAVTVITLVVRWRVAAPMASSACSRRFVAVTFLLLPVALMIAPVPARTDTLVAVRLASATLVPAERRREELVAMMLLLPSMTMAPPVAKKWMVPASDVLTVVPVAP